MNYVDPNVRDLARALVRDQLAGMGPEYAWRMKDRGVTFDQLIERAAAAMQQAIEHELEAIRAELTA